MANVLGRGRACVPLSRNGHHGMSRPWRIPSGMPERRGYVGIAQPQSIAPPVAKPRMRYSASRVYLPPIVRPPISVRRALFLTPGRLYGDGIKAAQWNASSSSNWEVKLTLSIQSIDFANQLDGANWSGRDRGRKRCDYDISRYSPFVVLSNVVTEEIAGVSSRLSHTTLVNTFAPPP
jgi:hypothetical protein